MVVIVREMCEIGPRRADAPRRRQCFVEAHVGWMRRVTQRVEHGDFDALDLFQRVGGDFLAVAQICEPFFAVLHEEIAIRRRRAVRQGQGNDFQITQGECSVNNVGFGAEIAFRNCPPVKRIDENTPKRRHRFRVRINRQCAFAQIAKPAAIVQTHDVIGVGMGENHRIEPADVFAEHLDAKFRRRVHDEFDLVRGDVNGRPGAMVLGIGQEFRRIFLADEGHALRRAAAEKNE